MSRDRRKHPCKQCGQPIITVRGVLDRKLYVAEPAVIAEVFEGEQYVTSGGVWFRATCPAVAPPSSRCHRLHVCQEGE